MKKIIIFLLFGIVCLSIIGFFIFHNFVLKDSTFSIVEESGFVVVPPDESLDKVISVNVDGRRLKVKRSYVKVGIFDIDNDVEGKIERVWISDFDATRFNSMSSDEKEEYIRRILYLFYLSHSSKQKIEFLENNVCYQYPNYDINGQVLLHGYLYFAFARNGHLYLARFIADDESELEHVKKILPKLKDLYSKVY